MFGGSGSMLTEDGPDRAQTPGPRRLEPTLDLTLMRRDARLCASAYWREVLVANVDIGT
jgi:hypothetical protein